MGRDMVGVDFLLESHRDFRVFSLRIDVEKAMGKCADIEVLVYPRVSTWRIIPLSQLVKLTPVIECVPIQDWLIPSLNGL